MRCFKNIILAVALAVISIEPISGWAYEAVQEQTALDVNPSWQKAFNYAQQNLSIEGILIVKSDGFGYLKVDDEYIHSLFPLLELETDGFEKPPYFRTSEAPGAHISVFYVDENIIPDEVGRNFRFELKQIVIVKPSKETSYAVLQVTSPELEKLREKYGLSSKLFGHEYHISLAKKNTPAAN